MARKRRAPPTPPQESDAVAAGEHGSDDVDMHAFQIPLASHPGPEADESAELVPEVPAPVLQKKMKKAATTRNSNSAVLEDKKRPAQEAAPSGRAKRTKAEAGKANPAGKKANAQPVKAAAFEPAPAPVPAAKGKEANVEQQKAAPEEATAAPKGKEANVELKKAAPEEATAAAKVKKTNAEQEKAVPEEATPAAKEKKEVKKPVVKPEDPGLDPSQPSKSVRGQHSVRAMKRNFDELRGSYPCLARCVEKIEAEHACGETLKRAFGYIDDEKANVLETKVKAQLISEVKEKCNRQELHNKALQCLFW